MCGISGILGKNPSLEKMETILMVMRHRGPEGTFYARLHSKNQTQALLGFLSLAFTDLAGGAQPMFNETKTIAAVCNGEFYDYREIREDLKKKGHQFFTQSDSEIAIHLYEEYGMEMFSHLNGEFAFAIYDSNLDLLIMARDRFGVKPLFYSVTNSEFIFASECKSILAIQDQRELNPLYFNATGFGSVESSVTPFLGIQSVRPGHVATWNGKEFTQWAYWKPDFTTTELSYEDAQRKLKELVLRGIQRRIDTNIPIATTLSGGLDSTIVTGLVKKHFGKNIKSFTLGYEDLQFSESPIAKMTADTFGVSLERVEVKNRDLIEHFLHSHYHSESIIKDFSGAARFMLNKAIKDSKHKAVLSGEGPDELMGGYAYFKLAQIWNNMLKGGEDEQIAKLALEQFFIDEKKSEGMLWNKEPNWRKYKDILGSPLLIAGALTKGQKFRKHILNKDLNNKLAGHSLWDSFDSEFNIQYLKSLTSFNKTRIISKSFFANYIAPTLGDRSEMANSLEGRAPFLDLEVINFAYTLPTEYCFFPKTFQGKRIVYDAFSEVIPAHFATIKKQPFRAPTSRSLLKTSDGKALYQTLLSNSAIKDAGIFNPRLLAVLKLAWKVAREDNSRFRKLDMDIGYFMSVQSLHHVFIEKFHDHVDLSPLEHKMVERIWNFK